MNAMMKYFKSSYDELKKVVWPERQEVLKIGLSIVLFVSILAAFMWMVDGFFSWVVYKVLLVWR